MTAHDDYCRHLTKCADAVCSYRQVAYEARAAERARIAAAIRAEAPRWRLPLTDEEASLIEGCARIAETAPEEGP